MTSPSARRNRKRFIERNQKAGLCLCGRVREDSRFLTCERCRLCKRETRGNSMNGNSKTPIIGKNTRVWDMSGLWGNYRIGDNCTIGKFVEIGKNVKIGNNCKIEAFTFIPPGVVIEDEVFIGPHVCFTNDKRPKAVGSWHVTKTVVKSGASIGANSTIVCGVSIGKGALVGAGSVVTKDVRCNTTVVGNPARIIKSRRCSK